jgi:hypothetical protein
VTVTVAVWGPEEEKELAQAEESPQPAIDQA